MESYLFEFTVQNEDELFWTVYVKYMNVNVISLPVYTLGTYTSPGDSSVMNSMLSAVGMCAEIPEYQMDAACGLAGSGPAYVSTPNP